MSSKERPRSVKKLGPGEAGRLLVVDDNEMNRDMLSRRLSRRGHTVLTADGGQAALDMLDQESFDVVLLDIMMPGIDGIEVLKTVRKTRSAQDLPIIMATAKDESSDVVEALKLGANDYVTKPLDFPVVMARVQTQLSLKRANDALAAAHARMKRDLDAAARVQGALLPSSPPENDKVNVAWAYHPCDELAGDALNTFSIDDRHICLYLLDVSGHGVPAALLSVSATRNLTPASDRSSIIREQTVESAHCAILPPAEVARRLNVLYPMESNGSHYFTMVYGIIDAQTGRFRFTSAGHPGPIVVRRGGAAELIDTSSFPIGIVDDGEYEESEVQLNPGDRLYLHSDGFNEEQNHESVEFGRDRLMQTLAANMNLPLQESIDSLVQTLITWRGDEHFTDDLSILGLEMQGV